MGSEQWSRAAYNTLASAASTKTVKEIFSSSLDPLMDPKGIGTRESRDSTEHPLSLALMSYLDVTGSMQRVPESLVKGKLTGLMDTLIDHGLADIHVMFGAVGDHYTDDAPLQVGQFEAGAAKLNQWLTKIWIEKGGGGHSMESYMMPWLIAARHTSIDCFEKRQIKGFLFTQGDEYVHPVLEADAQKKFLGYTQASDIKTSDLLVETQRMYHVFHMHVVHGGMSRTSSIYDHWQDLLGERALLVEDEETIAEVMALTVAKVHGLDVDTIAKTLDPKIAASVSRAVEKVTSDVSRGNKKEIFAL